MNKYLEFITASDVGTCFAAENLINISVTAATTLRLRFAPSTIGYGTRADVDQVDLTVNTGSGKEVIHSIMYAISQGDKAVIVVYDSLNSEYLNPNITACTITLDSA
tara:strand:- start:340 stop:660 length:321 start_codon:yes stop_codon:yes gene_type:complete